MLFARYEKKNYPQPRLKLTLNSIKNVHVPMKPQRVIFSTRGWEYFAKDYLWTACQEFCYETQRPIQKRWESAKNFFFEKPNKTMFLFRSAFQSTLLKHAGEVFFVLRNADFFKLKYASELSWGKALLIRVWYREQIMRHCWSVTLTYCCRLHGLSAFSNRHTVLRKL